MDNNRLKYDNNSDGVLKNGYKRNSFDRFGDDLCEEVLQYLSFSDKFRFECVSKQWKRCVYQRQYVLNSCEDGVKTALETILCQKIENLWTTINRMSNISSQSNATQLENNQRIINFERILRKCRKITRIYINFPNYNSAQFSAIKQIVTNNCEQLITLKFHLKTEYFSNEVYKSEVKDLILKYGNSLRTIDLNVGDYYKCLLGLCPNIVSLSNIHINDLIDTNSGVILAKKLCEIKDLKGCDDYELMNRFVDRYCDTIKVFHTSVSRVNYVDFMTQLSQFNNLENLSLNMSYFNGFYQNFIAGLKIFSAIRDKQIKHLSLYFVDGISDLNLTELLETISNNYTEIHSIKIITGALKRMTLIKKSEIKIIDASLPYNVINRFVTQYSQTIKVFIAKFDTSVDTDIMSKLSQLNKLESLSLTITLSGISFKLLNCFKEFAAIRGKQIIDLNLELKFERLVFSLYYMNKLFTIINMFAGIQSLRISGPYNLYNRMLDTISFKVTKNYDKLVHLEIKDLIDDIYFKDIEKYLPNLIVIQLENNYYNNIFNQTLYTLAKLKHLKEIHVKTRHTKSKEIPKLSHEAICILFECCEQFESLNFNQCPRIDSITILKFVEMARKRSHINFNHNFLNCTDEQTNVFEQTLEGIAGDFPDNLKITYK